MVPSPPADRDAPEPGGIVPPAPGAGAAPLPGPAAARATPQSAPPGTEATPHDGATHADGAAPDEGTTRANGPTPTDGPTRADRQPDPPPPGARGAIAETSTGRQPALAPAPRASTPRDLAARPTPSETDTAIRPTPPPAAPDQPHLAPTAGTAAPAGETPAASGQPMIAPSMPHPEIRRETTPVAYTAALAAMTERNAAIAAGTAPERIWLLEHPPVYTAGTSARPSDLLDPRFEIVEAGRGGKYTYHGPGQRIAYVLLDLNARGRDVRRFVHALEGWVIATLGDFGVDAWRSDTGVGIWTRDIDGREAKIGAIGVRVRRWVTMHGLSVNLAPDLTHFSGIIPCGIAEAGVTSLARIGRPVTAGAWDAALLARLDDVLAAIATPCPDPAQ